MKAAIPYETALKEMRKKKPDAELGLKLLLQALKKGDMRAAYALATWHLHGTHVEKDSRKAIALLKRAANENIPAALYDLAVAYEEGKITRKNEKKAYESYLKAAIWGDKQSIHEVGRCTYYGIGTSRNRRFANFWLDRARSLGRSSNRR